MNSSVISIVDSIDNCRSVCAKLEKEQRIAIDIKGVNLSRDGEICLIQAEAMDGTVYIFDICAMKHSAFQEGGLRSLLEGSTEKVFFDGRADADALWHQYGVRLWAGAVCDVQHLFCELFFPDQHHVEGLACALSHAPWVSERERAAVEEVKLRGERLFALELGGSYAMWNQRPMAADVAAYAACDVSYLLRMAAAWRRGPPASWQRVAAERMRARAEGAWQPKGPHMSQRDWSRPAPDTADAPMQGGHAPRRRPPGGLAREGRPDAPVSFGRGADQGFVAGTPAPAPRTMAPPLRGGASAAGVMAAAGLGSFFVEFSKATAALVFFMLMCYIGISRLPF